MNEWKTDEKWHTNVESSGSIKSATKQKGWRRKLLGCKSGSIKKNLKKHKKKISLSEENLKSQSLKTYISELGTF